MSSAAVEKRSKDMLLRYIYAAQKDIEANWNGPVKYSHNTHYSYDTVIKEKSKEDCYKHRFTISEPIGQMLSFLFSRLIEEINITELNEDDSIDVLRTKLFDSNAECFTDLMFALSQSTHNKFGDTLRSANDPAYWFRAKIINETKKHQSKERLISLLSAEFNDFFRSVAWLIAQFNWYNQKPVNDQMFVGLLATIGWKQEMLDSLVACLREKSPVKPKAAKGKTADEDATINANDAATNTASSEVTADNIGDTDNIGDIDDSLAGLI